ncbi:hypothetical protein MKW94_001013 [Papaver nudicaule]|uniref:Uncharacterized protein n=1 Tax=Papaver nudicaule TaxID=74823 RepID=A0AA41VR98_PAPNU|nr:hypothetical protein [Papaver nudicaule]
MKCPVGVSFGFGGKLVSYKPSQPATNPPTRSSELIHFHLNLLIPLLVKTVCYPMGKKLQRNWMNRWTAIHLHLMTTFDVL